LALQCSGEGHAPPTNRVGLSFGAFQTKLVFGDLGTVLLDEAAVGLSYERQLSKKTTLQLSGGGIALGHIVDQDTSFHGGFLGAGLSWNLVDQKGWIPFVMIGASASFSVAGYSRQSTTVIAADVRGSATVGYSESGFTPYAVARLFGGPVVLSRPGGTSLGTDQYHFQLGLGLVLTLPEGFDFSVEIVPLGEQRLSAGLGYSF
jgi:hypothetical protein